MLTLRPIGLVAMAATIQVGGVLRSAVSWHRHPFGDSRVSPQPLELLTLASPRIQPGALPSREGVQECGRPVMGTSRWGYGGQGGDVGPLDGDFCRSAVMRVPVEMPAAGLHPVSGS